MFNLSKPSRTYIEAFIKRAHDTDFSYPDIGLSRTASPNGYNLDHNRIGLGSGEKDFEKAKEAVQNWKMFDMPWVDLCWPDTPIEEGQTVAVLIRHFRFYSLNAARIVYTIEKLHKFGFAYGTLADHGESGEERFLVEMDNETGEVWYDIYAFSKPNHFLAKLGYPLTRMLQKQFAADSKTAMLKSQNR